MRARAGGASIIPFFPTPLPVKKSFAKKIFGLNLTLRAREARGIAHKQWASIAEAPQEPKTALFGSGVGHGFFCSAPYDNMIE